MQFGWWKKKHCPIGLDIGTHSIKLVQLEPRHPGFAVVAAATRSIPVDSGQSPADRGAAIAAVIKQLLESQPFRGRRVVSCMPATSLQYKNLRLPRMPEADLRTAVEWEASERLRIPANEMSVQYFDAGEVRQGEEMREEVIALAANNENVNQHVNILTQAGLVPVAIDAVPGALARCVSFALPPGGEDDSRVVLDIGYSSSKVLVLKAGRVMFFKLIEIGGKKLTEMVAKSLSLSFADAAELRHRLVHEPKDSPGVDPLVSGKRREEVEQAVAEAIRAAASELGKETGLCLRYYSVTFRGKRPDHLLLAGGESYEPQLARIICENADIQPDHVEPFAGIDTSNAAALNAAGVKLSEWAVAVGLAMRNVDAEAKRGAA